MTEHKQLDRRKVLIVLDNLESDWACEIVQKKRQDIEYDLLTIGISPDQAFLKYRLLAPNLRKEVNCASSADISQKADQEAREFYLRLIRDYPNERSFPGRTILQVLSGGGRNLWWYLGISEKNIWNDLLVHRLYAIFRLLLVCDVKNYQEAYVYVNDSLLRDTLQSFLSARKISVKECQSNSSTIRRRGSFFFTFAYFRQVCCELAKTILIIFLLKISQIKTNHEIKPGTIGFFSTYPDWWKNPFSDDAANMFFNKIPDELAKKQPVRHIIWLMPWQVLFKRRKDILSFLKKHSATILEGTLKPTDVFSFLNLTIFWKCLKSFRRSKRIPVDLKGIDISALIQEPLLQSLTSPTLFNCLIMDRALGRIPLQNLALLFFRLEFQPLERAILYNCKKKTKAIGFQHSALGKNFLNYVFVPGELGYHWEHRDTADTMPLPEYILTSGGMGIKYMMRAGYPEDRLAIGGAVRFSPLYDYIRNIPSKEILRKRYNFVLDRKILLIAPSPILQETECMLDDLLEAVGEKSSGFHLIIKCHPDAIKSADYMKRIRELIKKKGESISSEVIDRPVSLNDYIALSDAVLLSGGTVALEAMLLGSVPIIYVNEAQFSHNPMTEYPETVIFVDGCESMKRALALITDGVALDKLHLSWDRPIRDMFGAVSGNPEEKFLSAVRQQLHIPC
ncbi:MAG: hypothetical protein ABFD82_05890 [Syntrophaceae bacterium]